MGDHRKGADWIDDALGSLVEQERKFRGQEKQPLVRYSVELSTNRGVAVNADQYATALYDHMNEVEFVGRTRDGSEVSRSELTGDAITGWGVDSFPHAEGIRTRLGPRGR